MTTETDSNQTLADLIRAIGRLEGTVATKSDLHDVQTELKDDIHALRTELKADTHGLKLELKGDISDLRSEVKNLRTDVESLHKWSASIVGILIALLITLLGGLGFMGATLLDHAAQIGELRGANGRTTN